MGLRRPPGPYRIATFLREHDWDVEVIDYTLDWSDDELHELVKSRVSSNTIFIGFGCFFYYWNEKMDNFVSWLKQHYPNIKIVVGGQSRAIMRTANIDYYLHGYGEIAILELTKAMIGNSNANLTFDPLFFGSKKVITANHAYPAYPMKSLSVKYEERDDIQPWEWLTMEFARGCIFKCTYCNFPILGVKEDHTRTAEDFESDVRENYDRWGVKNYYVADETFNDYSEKIIKYANVVDKLDFKPIFTGFIRADLMIARPQDWEPLVRLGFFGQFYGIESMNKATVRAVGKGMDPEKIKTGLLEIKKYFSERGPYRGSVGIVVGLPHETVTSQRATLEWLAKHWAGESTHVWPLEIPLDPKQDVMSTLSANYGKFGYRVSTIMPPELPEEVLQMGIEESRITHINKCLLWENDNMSFADACEIADNWTVSAIRGDIDVGMGMFSFGDFTYPNLDLSEILKTKKMGDPPNNDIQPRVREYIVRKLNR
jgi:radical SAM superfamily enzyme YgiQ (UPF0313 family)